MSWVEEEFETIDLGDKRLNKRAIKIFESLGHAPGKTIPQSFKSWGDIKACYEFNKNNSFSEEGLLDPHIEKTIERIKEYPVVLLVSDTTDINYTSKKAMEGKERLTSKQDGLWLQPTIVVTPERLTLGIVEANFWHREPEVAEKSAETARERVKAPIEEKESFRWLQSYLNACEVARNAPDTQVIHMTDREGDIIELFELAIEQQKQGCFAHVIIRSQYNRLLEEMDEETKRQKKLWKRLKKEPSMGEIEFTIPPTEKRKGRIVKQQIKAATVTLKPENKNKSKVKINAVMAIEENPPEGEEALVWIFITTLPIKNFDDVSKILSFYLCRWEIELFFKILKGGCKIEERELQTTERMKKLIMTFLILTWRIQFTMMLGRVCSEMSAGEVFEEAEWKSVYKIANNKKALPRKPPKLGEFMIMIAKLGGYVDFKNAKPPGVKTMWIGMARMADFAIAWEAFGK